MRNLMRKAGTVLGAAALMLASLVATSTTAVAAPQQTVTAPATVALRVTCTDHDRRGIRYTSGGTPSYRVGARCESKRWAAEATGVGLLGLTATMCGMVGALGSPVSGAVCATIVAATSVTLLAFVREVRNDSRSCFAVIRNWRMGSPLIVVMPCRFERGAVPREAS